MTTGSWTDRSFRGYELVRELGRGGMGTVYLARRGGREVALKVLSDLSVEGLVRLQREAQSQAIADAIPGIARVHEAHLDHAPPFLVLEYVEGVDLESWLIAHPPPHSWAQVGPILRSIASSLAHIHARGLVHRDIKPANIMLREEDGAPVIMDFGLTYDARLEALTETGSSVGTPEIMAPEQLRPGTVGIGPWSDVWAFGLLGLRLLSGARPFYKATVIETIWAIFEESPFGDASLPSLHKAWIARCLERNPLDRLKSGAELVEALPPVEVPAPESKMSPLRIAAGVILVGGVALAAAIPWVSSPREAGSALSEVPSLSGAAERAVSRIISVAETGQVRGPEPRALDAQERAILFDIEVDTESALLALWHSENLSGVRVNRRLAFVEAALRALDRRDWPALVEAARSWRLQASHRIDLAYLLEATALRRLGDWDGLESCLIVLAADEAALEQVGESRLRLLREAVRMGRHRDTLQADPIDRSALRTQLNELTAPGSDPKSLQRAWEDILAALPIEARSRSWRVLAEELYQHSGLALEPPPLSLELQVRAMRDAQAELEMSASERGWSELTTWRQLLPLRCAYAARRLALEGSVPMPDNVLGFEELCSVVIGEQTMPGMDDPRLFYDLLGRGVAIGHYACAFETQLGGLQRLDGLFQLRELRPKDGDLAWLLAEALEQQRKFGPASRDMTTTIHECLTLAAANATWPATRALASWVLLTQGKARENRDRDPELLDRILAFDVRALPIPVAGLIEQLRSQQRKLTPSERATLRDALDQVLAGELPCRPDVEISDPEHSRRLSVGCHSLVQLSCDDITRGQQDDVLPRFERAFRPDNRRWLEALASVLRFSNDVGCDDLALSLCERYLRGNFLIYVERLERSYPGNLRSISRSWVLAEAANGDLETAFDRLREVLNEKADPDLVKRVAERFRARGDEARAQAAERLGSTGS